MRSPFRLPLALLGGLLLTLSACDSGSGIDPDPDGPLAEAVANIGQWTFLDVEGSKCRDGSDTGIGVRLQEGADDLMIYLEGGGACFNGETCSGNPDSFDESDFNDREAGFSGSFSLNSGIFSTLDDNPVGDWNMVYVPYCTGDVHGGSFPNALVGGPTDPFGLGPQQFVGHGNVERMLALLAEGLGDRPDEVLLTGASAGGFGTLVNFPAVAETFRGSDLTLFNDSGPIFFQDNVLSPQLAGGFVDQFGFKATLPGVTEVTGPDGLQNIYSYLDRTYPDATFGLASYLEDSTIRGFFGFGQPDGAISGAEFAAGLRDIRAEVPDSWGTYFAPGSGHTFVLDRGFYDASAGVTLNDWLDDLLDGETPDVDPSLAVAAR